MQPISCNTQEDKHMKFILHNCSHLLVWSMFLHFTTHTVKSSCNTEPPTSKHCVCTMKRLWLEQITSILVKNCISTARAAVWLWNITEVPLGYSALQICVGPIVKHGRSQFTSIHINQIFQNWKLNVHNIWQILKDNTMHGLLIVTRDSHNISIPVVNNRTYNYLLYYLLNCFR